MLAGEHGFELHVWVGIKICFEHCQLVQQVYLGLVGNRLGQQPSQHGSTWSSIQRVSLGVHTV
ncbi:hypothetical protein Hanom_Chr14g01311601 [Helianthus anomalus]